MPEYTQIILNMTWVSLILNIIEYTWICLNKHVSEYARVLNIPDRLQILYKVLSTSCDEASSKPCQTAKMEHWRRIIMPFN